MPGARFPVEMIGDVPVVRAPEDIDITSASDFQALLVSSGSHQASPARCA
jgi:hypothetical protein